jgi:hypothetical protein
MLVEYKKRKKRKCGSRLEPPLNPPPLPVPSSCLYVDCHVLRRRCCKWLKTVISKVKGKKHTLVVKLKNVER